MITTAPTADPKVHENLTAALADFASEDIALAREHGHHMIGDTLHGTLTLVANSDRTFTLTAVDQRQALAHGTQAEVSGALTRVYLLEDIGKETP